ncbi:MAG: hypothetical protein C4518_18845 [Desulfobacteraceae bacterium]|nr:MAG: hypothetical protein C4518_18845 [Desulfobacteraceae bacterium]
MEDQWIYAAYFGIPLHFLWGCPTFKRMPSFIIAGKSPGQRGGLKKMGSRFQGCFSSTAKEHKDRKRKSTLYFFKKVWFFFCNSDS